MIAAGDHPPDSGLESVAGRHRDVMTRRKRNVGFGIAVASAVVAAVLATYDGGDAGSHVGYSPQIDPTRFTSEISNPLLPLSPGARWVYEGPTGKGAKRIVVEVTHDRRTDSSNPGLLPSTSSTPRGLGSVLEIAVEGSDEWVELVEMAVP
jgi:hypothetical protein